MTGWKRWKTKPTNFGEKIEMIHCPLCQESAQPFRAIRGKEYFQCPVCQAVFLASPYHLSPEEEKMRYLKHNNDANDPNYQGFVRPIVSGVVKDFNQNHLGLDFGCGTGSAICKLLKDQGYNIKKYDPFFFFHPEVLLEKYEYIVCSEVAEHFRDPAKEFRLLRKLLKPNGKLFCLTERFDPKANFETWYYKNDPTHIFFFQESTFDWIRKNLGFSSLTIADRLATLTA